MYEDKLTKFPMTLLVDGVRKNVLTFQNPYTPDVSEAYFNPYNERYYYFYLDSPDNQGVRCTIHKITGKQLAHICNGYHVISNGHKYEK